MIVKDEQEVLPRCLQSIRSYIDSYSIVLYDTTDASARVIERELEGIPGEIHKLSWPEDFGIARTQGLQLAEEDSPEAQYFFVMDADDEIAPAKLPSALRLIDDAYCLRVKDGDVSYWRMQIFRARAGFRYEGAYHEVLVRDTPFVQSRIAGMNYVRHKDGASHKDPDKYRKAARILKNALDRDPTSTRTAFYLGQALKDAGDLEEAHEAFRIRSQMEGGWEEETWFALLEIAKLAARRQLSENEVIAAFLHAYEYRPTRAEPLQALAGYLRDRGRGVAALPFATAAACLPRPDDSIFLDDSVYAWRAKDEYAVALAAAGHVRQAIECYLQLLGKGTLPATERSRVLENLERCLSTQDTGALS
jgi:tetratricopeptide (TPR) repeat protein